MRALFRTCLLGAGLATVLAAPARGAPHRLHFTDLGPVRSDYERSGQGVIERDCGESIGLPSAPGFVLWVFCDTFAFPYSGQPYLAGSSAAIAPRVALRSPPSLVDFSPAPETFHDGLPRNFLALPVGLTRTNGEPCTPSTAHYAAPWTSGLAPAPGSQRVLVAYVSHCIEPPQADPLRPERFGIAEYDPVTNSIVADAPAIFAAPRLPARLRLGSPVVRGNALYLFAPVCDSRAYGTCVRGRVVTARVRLGPDAAATRPWTLPSHYRWWNGHGYNAAPIEQPVSIIPGARPSSIAVEADPALGRLVLIESIGLVGDVRIWSSRDPAGPWRLRGSGRLPNCRVGERPFDFCRSIILHPEMSTRSRLVVGYFQPRKRRIRLVSTRLSPR